MTTATTTTPISAMRRLLSISAVATIAAVGLATLSVPAHAAPPEKVWVCKYVGTPGDDERLKEGKNPIEVDGSSAAKDNNGEVSVGDQFADAQGRSIVVQIGGENPGKESCSSTPPPVDTPTTPPNGGKTPGTGAPHTGGEGGEIPVGLVGGGVLLAGAALVAAEAERRRRVATHQ
jgi:hypothetical protein